MGNVYSEIAGATQEELNDIWKVLAYELVEKERIREYKINEWQSKLHRATEDKELLKCKEQMSWWRDWDGKKHLFDKYRKRFPSGLWYIIAGLYPNAEVEGRFDMAEEHDEITYCAPVNLYDFQKKVVDEVIEFGGRCIIDVGTGGGKTEMAMWLMNMFRVKTVIIVHDATLEKQWVERMKMYYAIEKSDMSRLYRIDNKDVFMVATRKYIHNVFFGRAKGKQAEYEAYRLFLKDVGAVFYDECHHASTKQSEEILQNIEAYYRIGLSGTVDMRTDGTDIVYHGYLGPNVGKVKQEDLIQLGKATDPTIIFKPVGQRSFPRYKKYPEIIDEYIVENDHRNSLVTTMTREIVEDGRKVLVLVDRIRHINILTAIMELDEGIGGQVVGVKANSPHREEAFEKWMDMDSDEIMVMVCTVQLVGEGFDFPDLGGIVLAGSWKSKTRSIQTLGRLIRTTADKTDAVFIDFANNCEYLWEHSKERVKAWREEGFKVIIEGTFLDKMPELEETKEVDFNEK
jgi:superfamily II DNA or RNA helicase